MINTHDGEVKMKGNRIELLADFYCICLASAKHDCFKRDELEKIVYTVFESSEQDGLYQNIFDSFMEIDLFEKLFETGGRSSK